MKHYSEKLLLENQNAFMRGQSCTDLTINAVAFKRQIIIRCEL